MQQWMRRSHEVALVSSRAVWAATVDGSSEVTEERTNWTNDGRRALLRVGTAIVATVTVAASFGLMVPVTLHRMSVDPAIATGPFVTTGIDIVAILIYFWTCMVMLPT